MVKAFTLLSSENILIDFIIIKVLIIFHRKYAPVKKQLASSKG